MENFFAKLADINNLINDFIWIKIGLFVLIGTGILMSVLMHFFQVRYIRHWFLETIGSLFKKKTANKDNKKGISQFQAICTALAATIGTGNIAGVSAAIVIGGPGAVFWMWVSAFFGMMTSFSENVLGIYYRIRKNGKWHGGAMYYLKNGLAKRKSTKKSGAFLAALFSAFTVIASFGIGNMGQVNKITLNIESAFLKNVDLGYIGQIPIISLVIGGVIMVIAGVIIIGGLGRIAAVAEKIVPFMAISYIVGCLAVFLLNISEVGNMFASIFRFAFGIRAAGGALIGVSVRKIITEGCKKGVFSNEAGLGAAVIIHSSSDVKEPVKQGMWGIFQVFFDTFVVCTMTAVVVLSSGYINLETGFANPGVSDATLVSKAFGVHFGTMGEMFIATAMLLFAFTTLLGWSQYGVVAIEYLIGQKAVKFYRIIFITMIMSGAVMTSSLAWDISDTFNGFMMIPNLIGIILLCPDVLKITKNYLDRKIRGINKKPILSYYTAIEEEMEDAVIVDEK